MLCWAFKIIMKLIHWLFLFFTSLTLAGLTTALAETNEPNAAHLSPETAIPESTLPAQATFEHIANETGGTYIFKPDGSAEDYRDNFQKILNSMTEENKRGEGQ
jgi:hypothetical protein